MVGEMEHGRGTPMSSVELTEWRCYFQILADEYKQRHPDQG